MSPRVHEAPTPTPDAPVRVNLHRAGANWAANRARAKTLVDWEEWRDRAQAIRADAVAHLPELLEAFEARVTELGGHVHHAATAEQANATIAEICRSRGARLAVQAKSMTSEETGLHAALHDVGVTAIETDLGEYIVQALGQRPSHILAPAVHLSAVQVAELFGRLSGRTFDPEDAETLVGYARGALRDEFLKADVGLSGGNFLVAETGTLILVESEGNIRLTTSMPRMHIALVGIEKVLRDWVGAAHMVQMLPMAAHGRPTPASLSCITGPARAGDDGPEELHIVLLDDGRSNLLGTRFEDALHCIRCGACLYACPVYRQIGGHRYGSTYSGPIGAVITPLLEDLENGSDKLPELSSLCGACNEACPVKIPLDQRLVDLRAAARERDGSRAEAALFEAWARLWSRPASYRATARTAGGPLGRLWARAAGASADGWIPKAPFPFSGWTSERDAREPADEPFHRRWKARRG
jgi:L-lactate dehydrogenase complex protein LldF